MILIYFLYYYLLVACNSQNVTKSLNDLKKQIKCIPRETLVEIAAPDGSKVSKNIVIFQINSSLRWFPMQLWWDVVVAYVTVEKSVYQQEKQTSSFTSEVFRSNPGWFFVAGLKFLKILNVIADVQKRKNARLIKNLIRFYVNVFVQIKWVVRDCFIFSF